MTITVKKFLKPLLVVLALTAACFLPAVNSSPYYLDLWIMAAIRAILGMSFILLLRTGLINMGLVAFWGMGAYVSAIYTMKLGISFWLSLPMSVLTVGLCALLLGKLLLGGSSGGFSFVTLSMVIGMLFSVVVGNVKAVGGYGGMSNLARPEGFSFGALTIDFSQKVHFYYLALLILLVAVVVLRTMYASWSGRAWEGIGLNFRLAKSLGINAYRYRMLAFVVGAMLCAMAGCFYAHYSGFITPDSFSMWMNMYVQIYAILGGVAFPLAGPIVGSFIMTVLPELFRMTSTIASLFTGALLIVLILFLPQGVLCLFWGDRAAQLRDRLKHSLSRAGAGKAGQK